MSHIIQTTTPIPSNKTKFDIGIIGGGVAGCFAALRVAEKYPDSKAILIELGRSFGKRRRFLEGALGSLPNGDGKIYTNDLDKVLNITDGRKTKPVNSWVMDILNEVNPMKVIKDNLPSSAVQKRIKESSLSIMTNSYVQWKTDSIHQLSRLINERIEKVGNVQYSFDNEVFKIIKKKGMFQITSAMGDFYCKKVILCAGRSGWRWVNSLYRDLGLLINDDYARFGVRVEVAASNLKDFNRSHCTLSRNDLEIGPFSWFGSVIAEDHADVVISSFRSNEDRWKTDKVSFSVIASKYFKDQGCFQTERLGKLAFLLANDRIGRERIKHFIKQNSELYLVPEYRWLVDTFNEIEAIIPNIITRGYFHVPNILPMASQIRLGNNLESELDDFFVAGESAGVRGILSAALTGGICVDSICK